MRPDAPPSPTQARLLAIVAWAAIAAIPVVNWWLGGAPLGFAPFVGLAALPAFIVLFLVAHTAIGGRSTRRLRTLVVAQAAVILAGYWGLNDAAIFGLLVLFAMKLPFAFERTPRNVLLVTVNLVVAWQLATHMAPHEAAINWIELACFQALGVRAVLFALHADGARADLAAINAELVATRQLLLESARAEERLRLSRELHDVVGHKLTALKLQLRLAASEADHATPEHRATIGACLELSNELLNDVRGVVGTLREDDGVDLHDALRALMPAVPHPQLTLELAPDAKASSIEQAQALLRCAQEALTNALRHAHAQVISISLSTERNGLRLAVEDDGVLQTSPQSGHGLRGMAERVALLDGTLELILRAPHGLMVRAWLPHRAEPGIRV
jgi:signal transduction histidine kinase